MHKVKAKGILSASNGINIYRGCLHGCIYCDSRSDCYQMKHKFEDIEVKENAPELLEKTLSSKRKPCMIGTGAMSDPYIPLEKDLRIMRKCLEIIEKYSFGVTVHTKSSSVMRDIDILEKINRKSKSVLQMTLTTADEKLCKILEPNVSTTEERVNTLKEFQKAKIPFALTLCIKYLNFLLLQQTIYFLREKYIFLFLKFCRYIEYRNRLLLKRWHSVHLLCGRWDSVCCHSRKYNSVRGCRHSQMLQ
jgi:DNA repair photolyase